MSLKENKKQIQEVYDKGLYQGLSYNTKENKIFVAVKDGKHYKLVEVKSDYPLRDFENLKEFVQNIKVSQVKEEKESD